MMEHRQINCTSSYRPNNTVSTNNVQARPISQNTSVPCRKDLLDKINKYSFAMNEANLFLDTHPFDTEALAYFTKYRELRVEAVKLYAKYYAPLAIDYAKSDKIPWSWVNEPWPWEGVDC